MEENGEYQRCYHRYEAYADEAKAVRAYRDDLTAVGENAQHLRGDKLETQRAYRHQREAQQHRVFQRAAAAVVTARGVVETQQRDYAGLHRAERYKKERLPFVVKPQRGDGVVRKAF